MNIPFVDLKAQYLSIKDEIDRAMSDVINTGAFIGGSYVTQFEADFSAYLGIKHVIACANGTDSLEIIMKAMGIGPGDEVIVPALSWFSTSESVSAIGATPVFADISETSFTIDPSLLETRINEKTKAVIPVHLYGQAADMPAIMAIANKHKLKVIEDCAQSHGAEIAGKKAGLWGDAASFSFYPGKNLGAYGDAGCMATNNEALALTCRMIANHGQLKKHDHVMEGRNSRLDGLHAAVLSVKLKYLEKWTEARIRNAENYNRLLQGISQLKTPEPPKNGKHVYHLYVIRHTRRDALMQHLRQHQIECAIHYPEALPFLKAYAGRGYKPADFPVAHKVVREILSIPMYAELSTGMQSYVAETIRTLNE